MKRGFMKCARCPRNIEMEANTKRSEANIIPSSPGTMANSANQKSIALLDAIWNQKRGNKQWSLLSLNCLESRHGIVCLNYGFNTVG